MEGNSALAIEAARKVASQNPDEIVAAIPALEDFRPMPLVALVRFGKWDEILAEPQPLAEHQYSTGIWRWARGMALLRQGDLDAATAEYDAVLALAGSDEMQALALPSFSTAATNLQMAAHILAGELAAAQGDVDQAVSELEAAVAMQDKLPYIEPPAWYFPIRQTLGAVLLEADLAAEAEAVYREDLAVYPKNGWSLFGLMQSLEAQGRSTEAAEAQAQFEEAWQYADVTLSASRF
jgi:tetratricopeptide (TPR) repeat protein